MIGVLLIVFVTLHGLNGDPVYIVPSTISFIAKDPAGICHGCTLVVTGNGTIYIKETPEEAVKVLKDAPAYTHPECVPAPTSHTPTR